MSSKNLINPVTDNIVTSEYYDLNIENRCIKGIKNNYIEILEEIIEIFKSIEAKIENKL